MSTPDDFESEAGDAGTAAGPKHYQIKVPNFQEVAGPPGAGIPSKLADGTTSIATFTGNSFLRLGSSPTGADWTTAPFQTSVNLARLAGDPAQIKVAEGIQVGSSGAITTGNEEDSNASTLATGSGWRSGFQDGAGVPGPYGYEGDPNYLLGFADDTRFHAAGNDRNPKKTLVNGVEVDNDHRNRQAETLRLLTKGGWWDHSDGNRVTTTAGDKIEVIQGNYKMVVLGRQSVPAMPAAAVDLGYCYGKSASLSGALDAWYKDQTSSAKSAAVDTAWSAVSTADQRGITSQQIRDQYKYNQDAAGLVANALITDISGGHFQEQYPSPTPCIKTVEYVLDEATGEWTLYQDNGLGNLITKLKGRTVDLFQGPKREAYVGSKDGTRTDAGLDPELISKTWAQKIYSQTGSAQKPIGAGTTPSGFPDGMPADSSGLNNGDVFSVTWAQRILSYTGSSTKPVPYVYSETHAGQIKSVTHADGNVTSETTATGGNVTSKTTATPEWRGSAYHGGKVQNTTHGSLVTNVTTAAGDVANVTAAGGNVINVNSALAAVNLNAALDIINLNVGVASIVNLNLGVSLFNIDLTPISVHCGSLSYEMAASKWVAAPNVQVGTAPLPLGTGVAAAVVGAIPAILQGGLGTIE